MFDLDGKGSEKEGPKKPSDFLFDIEEEIKKDPKKLEELNKKVSEKLQEYKKVLNAGIKPEEASTLKDLIEGYTAMAKILAVIGINTKKEKA
jgi:hypothetical protein